MWKIFKYSFYDMLRNRWMFVYAAFFMLLTFALLGLSNDLTKVVITLTNVILTLTPMIGILFGTMYYYNSLEFVRLLLAQPIGRASIFIGMYLGLAISLSISLIVGVGLPMVLFGVIGSESFVSFLLLGAMSIILSLIFSLFGFLIALNFENRIKGFGLAIFTWLFFTIIYDGLFLLILLFFKDYPLEKTTLALTFLNPVDLSRILIIMKLEISAMMGYTGAVLQNFLGSGVGSLLICLVLFVWFAIPFFFYIRSAKRKDF